MKSINVVCGIIYWNNKVFIARRKQGKSMDGKWEFPGGKVEEGEDNEWALRRELKEEFGMEVLINGLIGNNVHHYQDLSINLIAYKCDFLEATFKLTDHDKFVWVKPTNLLVYDFTLADVPFVKMISK